jgi:hypothetical protein
MHFILFHIYTLKKATLLFVLIALIHSLGISKAQQPNINLNQADLDDSTIHSQEGVYDQQKPTEDTSENFFNWKGYSNEPYKEDKIEQEAGVNQLSDSFKNAEEFWYVDVIERFKANEARVKTDPRYKDSLIRLGILPPDQTRDDATFTFVQWYKTVLWIIIIGTFLFGLVYFLMSNKIKFFSLSPAISKNDSHLADATTNFNIFQLPYQDLLKKAYTDNNFRLSVRILFLQTLKLMNDISLIQFQPEHTNMYYVGQLRNTPYYDLFLRITKNYEHVWYGKFELTEPIFNRIKEDFEAFHEKLN